MAFFIKKNNVMITILQNSNSILDKPPPFFRQKIWRKYSHNHYIGPSGRRYHFNNIFEKKEVEKLYKIYVQVTIN
jgi:hypothetical protein